MDVTPEGLRTAELPTVAALDPGATRSLLAAAAERIEQLEAQLAAALERASALEGRLTAAEARAAAADATPSATADVAGAEQALLNLLSVTKRTAESALGDARATAARLVADAEREAEEVVRRSREEATRVYEETRAALEAEVRAFELRLGADSSGTDGPDAVDPGGGADAGDRRWAPEVDVDLDAASSAGPVDRWSGR